MTDRPLTQEQKTIAQRLAEMDALDTPAYANELMREAAAEIERLQDLVPSGDYVLVEEMDEGHDRRWGKGLFATFDIVRNVS